MKKVMIKNIINSLLLVVVLGVSSCNDQLADELFEKYKDWIKKVNATSVYNYYLKVERTQPAQGSIEVINMTTTWSKWLERLSTRSR